MAPRTTAFELLMRANHALAPARLSETQPLSSSLELAGTPEGCARLTEYLASRPFPHFEAASNRPGLLVRTDKDGTRTLGRFVLRVFTPLEQP